MTIRHFFMLVFAYFAVALPAQAQPISPRDAASAVQLQETASGCNRLVNHVDTPLAVSFDQNGNFRVPLDGGVIMDVRQCRRLHFEIGTHQSTANAYELFMGKISGSTLSQRFTGSPNNQIRTMEIIGPDLTLWLKGPANTQTKTQLWLWVHD